MKKEYLGDGLYAQIEAGSLVLTAENGVEVFNKVYLDPEVWSALLDYVARLNNDEDQTNRSQS